MQANRSRHFIDEGNRFYNNGTQINEWQYITDEKITFYI